MHCDYSFSPEKDGMEGLEDAIWTANSPEMRSRTLWPGLKSLYTRTVMQLIPTRLLMRPWFMGFVAALDGIPPCLYVLGCPSLILRTFPALLNRL